jgi:hypothetical protein
MLKPKTDKYNLKAETPDIQFAIVNANQHPFEATMTLFSSRQKQTTVYRFIFEIKSRTR